MKKIIFGVVVAAMAMLSACENFTPVEDAPSGNTVGVGSGSVSQPAVLTATIGTDTKTFLEWDGNVFKTRWAEEDYFLLWNADVDLSQIRSDEDYERYASWYVISEGVGESTATFVLEEGVMPERFIALYGEFWPEREDGNWYYWLPENQGREVYETKDGELIQGFDSHDYPMYATGEGQELHFRNMLSVFKINVTGRGEILKNITITALDENIYLAGVAKVDLRASRPTFEFSPGMLGDYEKEVYNSISFNPNLRQDDQEIETVLSSDPVECYIIVPPRSYPSGFKVTLTTDAGVMEFETESDLSFEPSELRELNVSYENTSDDIGTTDAVECKSYSDIAYLSDNTAVKVTGYVMATYGYGFIMSVGMNEEFVLVYTKTEDVNGKIPVAGTYVEVYASKTTYRGLPELENVARFEVLNDDQLEFDLTPIDLSSSDFENFSSGGYDYVKFRGHLSKSGSYYNVNVDGATRIGSISRPLMDMEYYVNQDVVVEGFFCGLNTDKNGKEYFNVVATRLNVVASFSASIEGATR